MTAAILRVEVADQLEQMENPGGGGRSKGSCTAKTELNASELGTEGGCGGSLAKYEKKTKSRTKTK